MLLKYATWLRIWQDRNATRQNTHASKCGKSKDCSGQIARAHSTPTTGTWQRAITILHCRVAEISGKNMYGMRNFVEKERKKAYRHRVKKTIQTSLRIMWIYKSPGRKRNKISILLYWTRCFLGLENISWSALEIHICVLLLCEVEDK